MKQVIKKEQILDSLFKDKGFLSIPINDLTEYRWSTHNNLIQLLENTSIPYFWLHATSRKWFKSIMQQETWNLNLATYGERRKGKDLLYSLYNTTYYLNNFTRPKDNSISRVVKNAWNIMIFDLEKDGKNISSARENLNGSTLADRHLITDEQYQERIGVKKRQRTGVHFVKDKDTSIFSYPNFKERFIWSIDMGKDRFHNEIPTITTAHWVYNLIKERLKAQDISKQVIELILHRNNK